FSGVEKFIDTPVKRYSSGMYVRLAFAVAAHLEPDVLIIDEVLAVGDAEFQNRCLGKMNDVASAGRTVLFVSHNMAAVQNLCQRALLLRSGGLVAAGEAGAVVREYLHTGAPGHAESDFEDGRPNDGYLYRSQQAAGEHEAIPGYVRVLGDDGRPLDRVETWDSVTFEICVDSSMSFRNLAVALTIHTPDQVRVLHTSTQPDHLLEFKVEPGRQCV